MAGFQHYYFYIVVLRLFVKQFRKLISFSFMPGITSPGLTDLEQKSSADEREAYVGTLSEETRIE